MPDQAAYAAIARRLLAWWDEWHSDLPWRRTRDPYAIWVAEVMLQQTQVNTVIPYYERWLARFPTVQDLAAASLDEVLKMWEGLGYYGRARNLLAAAQKIVAEMEGQIPRTAGELQALAGIGAYTAGAIASIAFDAPVPALDANVIRVLSRLLDVAADVTRPATRRSLWQEAARMVPAARPGDFNQALMELGQRLCVSTWPECALCPLGRQCLARQRGTQLERPVRPPRRVKPHRDVVAGIIWRNGARSAEDRFLITRRPLNGLLGGLWEFPGGKKEAGESLEAALRREIEEELAIEIAPGPFLAAVPHTFTHFRMTLYAFHARHVAGRPRNIGVAEHAWVRLGELDQYAFGLADRKIIGYLQEEMAE